MPINPSLAVTLTEPREKMEAAPAPFACMVPLIVHGNSLNPPDGGKACPFNQPVIGGDVDDVATDRKDERASRARAAIRLNSATAIGHCDVTID